MIKLSDLTVPNLTEEGIKQRKHCVLLVKSKQLQGIPSGLPLGSFSGAWYSHLISSTHFFHNAMLLDIAKRQHPICKTILMCPQYIQCPWYIQRPFPVSISRYDTNSTIDFDNITFTTHVNIPHIHTPSLVLQINLVKIRKGTNICMAWH